MARERRFFVADLEASPVELSADEAHHLVHVLRLKKGDDVVLFDGQGHAAQATVTLIDGDAVELEIGGPVPTNESPLALTVAVAVPKGDAMELIVQKLTELGVATIQPLVSDHGEIRKNVVKKRLERWERIALEAAKQCGRSRLPVLEPPRDLPELAEPGSFLLTPGAPPLTSTMTLPSQVVVFVGPEGGWSEAELSLAKTRALKKFGLGPRTLRTETAAIAAATLMQWLGGDLR